MAFITAIIPLRTGRTRATSTISARRPATVRSARTAVRMGVGEDGLQDDIDFAKNCIAEGCSVDAVQGVLTRLEQRRAVLALEVSQIEDIMAILARENLGGDRGLISDAMEAAMSIFAKAADDYPAVSNPSGYTMDPLKKQPKF